VIPKVDSINSVNVKELGLNGSGFFSRYDFKLIYFCDFLKYLGHKTDPCGNMDRECFGSDSCMKESADFRGFSAESVLCLSEVNKALTLF
jgi:hypothetical protein